MHNIKILIVEDEAISAMFLKKEFEEKNFTVCEFTAYSETAIEIFHNEKPDIILMDVRLTRGLDGIETAKIIKKENPEIPVIFITGYEDEKLKAKAMVVNPLAYMIKPLNIDTLVKIIQDHFDAHK